MKKVNLLYMCLCLTLVFFGGQSFAQTNLDLEGNIKVADGNEGVGKVLTSDAVGIASWQAPLGKTYAVGDFAQGGIVVWVDETSQHGIVCAKSDQHTAIRWSAGDSTNTMARGRGPLAGEMATTLIIANQGYGDGNDYAALHCSTLEITEGGKTYGDWYLPSWEIIQLMYDLRTTIDATAALNGGDAFTVNGFYWSSFEFDSSNPSDMAMAIWFAASGGGPDAHAKSETQRVRAVRAF